MKKYTTGSFAEIYGLSPEGMKYYIKHGLLQPKADDAVSAYADTI